MYSYTNQYTAYAKRTAVCKSALKSMKLKAPQLKRFRQIIQSAFSKVHFRPFYFGFKNIYNLLK